MLEIVREMKGREIEGRAFKSAWAWANSLILLPYSGSKIGLCKKLCNSSGSRHAIDCAMAKKIAIGLPCVTNCRMCEENHQDLELTLEEQASGPFPIECLLPILDADFPELVERARAVLEYERIPRGQAEVLVRDMIDCEQHGFVLGIRGSSRLAFTPG